jgi:hypothetical protein
VAKTGAVLWLARRNRDVGVPLLFGDGGAIGFGEPRWLAVVVTATLQASPNPRASPPISVALRGAPLRLLKPSGRDSDNRLVGGDRRDWVWVPRGLGGWRWRRAYRFSPALEHEHVVPPGPDGMPGERLWAPSRSFHPPRMTLDNCREDLRVLITPKGSTLGVVCFGRISEKGDPLSSARYTLTRAPPFLDPEEVIEPDTVAGEAAVRYREPLNTYRCLIEWKFAHAGWLYAAGALVYKNDDEAEAEDRARDILSTWQWLD